MGTLSQIKKPVPWTFSTWKAWCHKPRSGTTAQGWQQKGNFPLTTPDIYQDREEEHLARCPWWRCLYVEGFPTSPITPGQKIDSCLLIIRISRLTRIAIIPSWEQSSCYLATSSWVPPLRTVALGIKFPVREPCACSRQQKFSVVSSLSVLFFSSWLLLFSV